MVERRPNHIVIIEQHAEVQALKTQLSEAKDRERKAFEAARELHKMAVGLSKHGTLWKYTTFSDYEKGEG